MRNDKSSISGTEKSEFLDNFNWKSYAEGIEVIDNKQLEEFEKLLKIILLTHPMRML